MKPKLTISIDLELAWGVWDILTPDDLRLAETAERPICAALLAMLDRHRVPATWAIVAALLDAASARSRPGNLACWHAPDVIAQIVAAKVRHEIGSHGGRHIYFNVASADDARADLEFAKSVHQAHALPFCSLVFPRNAVGHLDLIAEVGLRTYRGPDVGMLNSLRHRGGKLGKIANFVDKALPLPPQPAVAAQRGALIDIPGSMQILARNGARRFILPQVTCAKLALGLKRARRTGGTFHLWFHPSNFYYRSEEQLDVLDRFLAHAAHEAGRGQLDICTMGAYADDARASPQARSAA